MKTTLQNSAIALAIAAVCPLNGHADLIPATFEGLLDRPESHWIGDIEDEDYVMGTFRSGSFEFSNFYWADYGSWAWCGYANHTFPEAGTEGTDLQWYATAGSGHKSPGYGLIYYADWIGPTWCSVGDDTKMGYAVPGMWVCNNAWTSDFIRRGDGMGEPFKQGDTLTLTVKGTAEDNTEKEVSILLADCTSENPEDWDIADDWRWMDLSTLGEVITLEFAVVSTKQNQFGDLCPSYVCIDDLGTGQTVATDIAGASRVRTYISGNRLYVNFPDDYADVALFTISGQSYCTKRLTGGQGYIDLPSGISMVCIHSADSRQILKIIH